jgi:hypothetical protein
VIREQDLDVEPLRLARETGVPISIEGSSSS